MVSVFIKNPDVLEKIREEFKTLKEAEFEKNPDLKSLNKEDLLRKLLNHDSCQELPYLNCVLQETFRIECPVKHT